jgi:hypothetical protein
MSPTTGIAAALASALLATPAFAWGDLGHEIIAKIGYSRLTPAARAEVDALLASDTDALTAPDFAGRAAWADKYRTDHRPRSELFSSTAYGFRSRVRPW